ncbi:MAG: ABC transporter ATP-binding protein [Candidatus Omnitrophota bacterium]
MPITIWRFFRSVFKEAPLKVSLMLGLLVLAGALEGMGFALFLPLIRTFMQSDHAQEAGLIESALAGVGLNASIPALLALIIVSFGVKNTLLYYGRWFSEKVAVDFEFNLRKDIIASTLDSDWNFYLKEKVGSLMGTLATHTLHAAYSFRLLTQLATEVINLVAYCLLGLFISWQTFVVSFFAGILCVLTFKNVVRLSRKVSTRSMGLKNEAHGLALEDFTGIKFIKGNRLEEERKKAVFGVFDKLRQMDFKSNKYLAIMDTLPDFLMACAVSFILYVSYVYVKVPSEKILVVTMVLYRMNKRVLFMQVMAQKLATHLPAYEMCAHLIGRARTLREKTGQTPFQSLEKGVRFENVGFGYDDSQPVLHSVTMEIRKDRLTALVGKSGSGKTTILDLTLGLLRPQTGSLFIDDVDIGRYDIFSWRERIGYVPQEAFLMNGTIFENIQMGHTRATREEIIEAAKMSHADEFIRKQPQGYETLVGDRGIKLSGGQRQRIALARALVRKPQVLILDEATSALDNESERMVKQAINELKGSFTLFIVAHRLTTIENADVIYVLDEGRIVESGECAELLAGSRIFNHLYQGAEARKP